MNPGLCSVNIFSLSLSHTQVPALSLSKVIGPDSNLTCSSTERKCLGTTNTLLYQREPRPTTPAYSCGSCMSLLSSRELFLVLLGGAHVESDWGPYIPKGRPIWDEHSCSPADGMIRSFHHFLSRSNTLVYSMLVKSYISLIMSTFDISHRIFTYYI